MGAEQRPHPPADAITCRPRPCRTRVRRSRPRRHARVVRPGHQRPLGESGHTPTGRPSLPGAATPGA
ncbi:hypothetical protein TOK_5189 [Pseudonocardia sp. N23]|nr:hypothetical protein TOK_5189 [Pseudonocardia sp. N23]